MFVTLSGMVRDVKPVHPEKESSYINFVCSLIVQEVMEVSFAFTKTIYGFVSFPR